MLLGNQRCVFDKAGIGYNPIKKQKNLNTIFKKAPLMAHPHITSHYCRKKGHYISSSPFKKNINMGIKKIWIVKGSNKTNQEGPKKLWVPKSICMFVLSPKQKKGSGILIVDVPET